MTNEQKFKSIYERRKAFEASKQLYDDPSGLDPFAWLAQDASAPGSRPDPKFKEGDLAAIVHTLDDDDDVDGWTARRRSVRIFRVGCAVFGPKGWSYQLLFPEGRIYSEHRTDEPWLHAVTIRPVTDKADADRMLAGPWLSVDECAVAAYVPGGDLVDDADRFVGTLVPQYDLNADGTVAAVRMKEGGALTPKQLLRLVDEYGIPLGVVTVEGLGEI